MAIWCVALILCSDLLQVPNKLQSTAENIRFRFIHFDFGFADDLRDSFQLKSQPTDREGERKRTKLDGKIIMIVADVACVPASTLIENQSTHTDTHSRNKERTSEKYA